MLNIQFNLPQVKQRRPFYNKRSYPSDRAPLLFSDMEPFSDTSSFTSFQSQVRHSTTNTAMLTVWACSADFITYSQGSPMFFRQLVSDYSCTSRSCYRIISISYGGCARTRSAPCWSDFAMTDFRPLNHVAETSLLNRAYQMHRFFKPHDYFQRFLLQIYQICARLRGNDLVLLPCYRLTLTRQKTICKPYFSRCISFCALVYRKKETHLSHTRETPCICRVKSAYISARF